MSRRRPGWAPAEPKHTCPSIDAMQRKLRSEAEMLEDHAAVLRAMADELEEIRSENVAVRSWGEDCIIDAGSVIDDLEEQLKEAKEAERA